jgi:GTP cyclohydrolase I
MTLDRAAAERAIADFLRALGHPTDAEPELAATPERVVEAFTRDLLAGSEVDISALLTSGAVPASAASADGLVVVRDIDVVTVCPHHLLPAQGTATVAYWPGTKVLGLGTLAHLVNALSRRLTLQERIGREVVDALVRDGGARGAFCRLSLTHSCLTARGARQSQATVHTTATAGALSEPEGLQRLRLALDSEVG